MPLTLDKIEIAGRHKHLQIREVKEDGGYHRRVLTPDVTLDSDEHQKIKDKAAELWTDEVKAAWTAKQAESTL
jgi:hypothetical protein